MIRRRGVILSSLAASMIARPAAASGRVRLRLLETSDLHMFARDFDYYRDRLDETVGLSKVASLIGIARKEAGNSLLFDNGDIIQGNPLGDYVARPHGLPPGAVHPFFRAMNTLRYDAATVGNHEFNYGLPFLERSLRGAAFPFVCANIRRASGASFLPPTLILNRTVHADDGTTHSLRIGVIGFVTPQIMVWDKTHLEGRITTEDIVAAAMRHLPALRARCDIVVALSHSGISAAPPMGGDENASLYLAKVPGIDAIFTGHSHRVFPGPDYADRDGADSERGTLHGIPAVMPGYWGSHLGMIDLVLEQQGRRWGVVDFAVQNRPIYRRDATTVVSLAGSDASIEAAVAPEHEATRAQMARPVGRLTHRLSSYFALTGDDSGVNLINAAQLAYAKQLFAGTGPGALPLLSAAAPFKAGGLAPDYYLDMPAGPVAYRDVADIYPYPNTLAAVRIDGATVREWLERAAGVFRQIDPSASGPQELIDRKVPSYNFDVLSGITWRIDLRQPARYDGAGKVVQPDAHRIVDLEWDGRPIDPDRMFVVITNNYRADGGGGFPGLLPENVVLRAPDTNRDILIRYISERPDTEVTGRPSWGFVPTGGSVTATFDCSPAARALLADRPGIEWIGAGDKGWDRFGLTF